MPIHSSLVLSALITPSDRPSAAPTALLTRSETTWPIASGVSADARCLVSADRVAIRSRSARSASRSLARSTARLVVSATARRYSRSATEISRADVH